MKLQILSLSLWPSIYAVDNPRSLLPFGRRNPSKFNPDTSSPENNPSNLRPRLPAQNAKSMNVRLFAIIGSIENYGCWCNFEENWRKGRAEPLDIFDAECRTLMKNYDCIYHDAFEETGIDNTCIPYEIRYNEPLQLSDATTDQEIKNVCETENVGNDCKIRTCISESTFVRNLQRLNENHNQTPEYSHTHNSFDFDAQCPQPVFNLGEKKCCGKYPQRFPYKDDSGDLECCGNRTYNTLLHTCCSEQVQIPGSCLIEE